MALLARDEAIVAGVVQAAKRQRGAKGVAFAGVVQHDVEHRLYARLCQSGRGGGDLRPAPGREPRIRGQPGDGIVAPVVGQPEGAEVPLIDPGGGGHELDRGDPKLHQVLDRLGAG